MALLVGGQIALLPLQAGQFLRKDSLRLDLRCFQSRLPRMILTHFTSHLLQAFLPE
jgi:hypothetical protein